MQDPHKTAGLTPDERAAVERLLGRPLGDGEAIEVVVHGLDERARRRSAAERIRELAKGKQLGGLSIRDLIDEGRRF